jgi:glucosamine-6-phosphate deaminase
MGTLDRLVEHGHEVHIAYQTSGNLAVSNEEALKFVEVSEILNPTPIPQPSFSFKE